MEKQDPIKAEGLKKNSSQGEELPFVAAVPISAAMQKPEITAKPLRQPQSPSPGQRRQAESRISAQDTVVSAGTNDVMADVDGEIPEDGQTHLRQRSLLRAVPSWLVSLLIHLVLILILAMISLEPITRAISILQASSGAEEETIDAFDLNGPSLDSQDDSLEDPLAIEPPATSEIVAVPEISSPTMPTFESDLDALETNRITESIIPSSLIQSNAWSQTSSALNSRSAAARGSMLERYGGNAASEKAVALALKWIAEHQAPDGGWTFAHSLVCKNTCQNPGSMDAARNGATAMALLPFLGAGQTHLEGDYKKTVFRGLEFLINRLQVTPSRAMPLGSWHEPGGRMYSHALAAITVCEAYAMTRDPDLLQPAQLSLNYLIQAQDSREGGWRYNPGDRGDTSVVGWCLMALKSGKMGNLVVPQGTFQATDSFLNYVSTNRGAYYGYTKPTSNLKGREATTAVGLLCRMYLGYPKDQPGLQEGIRFLSETGPKLNDLYYSYYATQVMRHHGGEPWERWNNQMRDGLIKAQETSGHAAGSWYKSGSHTSAGGRLYTTSLSTMILEVYYRHMPLYSERSSVDDFEI